MTPLTPEQGGVPYDLVHQAEDGKWYYEAEQGGESVGPFLSEIGAREGMKAAKEAEEKIAEMTRPRIVGPAMTEHEDGTVELDPEAAEHRLSHAAQDLVNAAITMVRNTRSDVIVRREDMAALRAGVKEFDLAYATVVALGKVLSLAQQAEQQTPLGDNVVDASYGEVPQEKLDARYEAMIAEREAELAATEGQGDDPLDELQAQAAEWPLPPENCPAPGSDLAECLGEVKE